MNQITQQSEDYLKRLIAELDVPPGRYESAERSFKSVGAWLDREESSLKEYSPTVYVQGSFGLGTAVKPVNDQEDYDVDLVCELDLAKSHVSQATLKKMLGVEMVAYAQAYGMESPREGRRCWTLDYAEGAQFHLDALPALPDGYGRRLLLEARALDASWSGSAIAITDKEGLRYDEVHDDWPHSNPRGYLNWFHSRMKAVFESRRSAMALEARASVEDIPTYRVKTPLQEAVQILKRHRDTTYKGPADDKPISIIITTLAAKSYGGESSITQALRVILAGMNQHIESRKGVWWVENPTDPAENFADRWTTFPQRREQFIGWLRRAQADFARVASESSVQRLVEAAAPAFGTRAATAAANFTPGQSNLSNSWTRRVTSLFSAGHRKPAPWPVMKRGNVSIVRATARRNGFRPSQFVSESGPLPKSVSLTFQASTDIPAPFDVYWQVVNTGREAELARDLRGDFGAGRVERGTAVHSETAKYAGSHTIECFVVKDGYLVARSGAFVVNVA